MEARRLDRKVKIYRLMEVRGSSGSKKTMLETEPFLVCMAMRNDYHRDRMAEMVVNEQLRSKRITTWRFRYSQGVKIDATMLIEDDRGEKYNIINLSEVSLDGLTRRKVGRRKFIDVMTEVVK